MKGRVASHPKKTTPAKKPKGSASNKAGEQNTPQILPRPPLTSAWDDYMHLSNQGVEFPALVMALQTHLPAVIRQDVDETDVAAAGPFNIYIPPCPTAELREVMDDAFGMNGQCFVRQKATNAQHDPAESYCVFLFEHDRSGAPGRLTAEQMSWLGPRHFTSFPNHLFFARVYRPVAMSLALMSRRDTFLSTAAWSTIPWEQHPKSLLDRLFDIIVQIPSLLAQADRTMLLQATLTRRTQLQELLHCCMILESQFRQWLQEACKGTVKHPYPFWAEEPSSPCGAVPFANAYTFRNGLTGLMFLFYWMSQISFHRCIEDLHMAIFQPVVDAYPNMWPDLPPDLQIDPAQYQDRRELATNICRGLESTLDAIVQPDMLLAPTFAALNFYREINATAQDGVLEILWLEDFKKRLSTKRQAVANVLQTHKWVEAGKF